MNIQEGASYAGHVTAHAVSTKTPDLGGFDLTRPSMDASIGSRELDAIEGRSTTQGHITLKRKSLEHAIARSVLGEPTTAELDVDDFDF